MCDVRFSFLTRPLCTQGKSVAMYCLEGFSLLLHTALVRWERGDGFLTAVNPSLDGSTSPSERTHYFIRHLQVVQCLSLSLCAKLSHNIVD